MCFVYVVWHVACSSYRVMRMRRPVNIAVVIKVDELRICISLSLLSSHDRLIVNCYRIQNMILNVKYRSLSNNTEDHATHSMLLLYHHCADDNAIICIATCCSTRSRVYLFPAVLVKRTTGLFVLLRRWSRGAKRGCAHVRAYACAVSTVLTASYCVKIFIIFR